MCGLRDNSARTQALRWRNGSVYRAQVIRRAVQLVVVATKTCTVMRSVYVNPRTSGAGLLRAARKITHRATLVETRCLMNDARNTVPHDRHRYVPYFV